MKRFIRYVIQELLLLLEFFFPTKGVPVLLYHKTSSKEVNPFIPNISVDTFQKQVDYLKKRGYTTINTKQLFDYLYNGTKLPGKPVIITFDDGYKDNMDAFKILSDNGFSAICFVATSFLNKSYDYMPFYLNKGCVSFETSDIRKELFEFMSDDDISRALALGVEMCGHTHHHIDIPEYSEDVVLEEVKESKKIVDRMSGQESIAFSYPRGKYNEFIKQMLPTLGGKISFAVKAGVIRRDSDPLELPRYNVPSERNLFRLALTNKIVLYETLSRIING